MFAKVREVLIFTHSNFIDKSVRRCLYNVNYESGRGAAASRAAGAEQRYLIQHLAGSGKSLCRLEMEGSAKCCLMEDRSLYAAREGFNCYR